MKVVGNVQATPKGEKPALKKQIKNNNTGMWSETGNAAFQLGDTVSFRMVVTVPDTSRYTDGYIYKIYDTMTEGLTSNVKTVEDFSIEIKNDPNNKLDSKYCSLVTSKIMVDGKEVDHFELSIDIKQANGDGVIEAGNDLCVNYTAVLNDKADFYIIGEGKNTNTAYLEYSNNPNGEGTGKTPESSVHAWTFAMIVSKIDGTTKAPLTGAKFVLSRRADLKVSDMLCDENGNPTVKTDLLPMYTGDSARAPYELVTAEKVAADNNITYTAELGDGIVFAGFGEFTYYLSDRLPAATICSLSRLRSLSTAPIPWMQGLTPRILRSTTAQIRSHPCILKSKTNPARRFRRPAASARRCSMSSADCLSLALVFCS